MCQISFFTVYNILFSTVYIFLTNTGTKHHSQNSSPAKADYPTDGFCFKNKNNPTLPEQKRGVKE